MKKTFLLLAAVLFSAIAIAQNPIQPLSAQNPWNDRPDVIIKGEELKNFPGGQLTEMLLGRLPGLEQVNPQEMVVTFVVDGFVWPSIDALNINNIEEVAYYRGGLNSKFGVQNTNPGGVLYITTKTAKFKQPLNATVNTLLGTNILKKEDGKDRSTLQSYHVALAQGIDKFSWRSTAGYNKNTRNLKRFDFTHQFQLNGDVRFSPLRWLDLGVNVNYAPSKGDSPIEKNPVRLSELESKYKGDNWNGVFYVKAEPLKGLVNEVRVLKSNVVSDDDVYSSSESGYNEGARFYSKTLAHHSYRNFAFLNDLSYRFSVSKDRIKFKTSAFFQYNDQKFKENLQGDSYIANGGDVIGNTQSISWLMFTSQSKMYTFFGDLSVNFYNVLSLQGGVRSDNYKGSDGRDFYAPYYYADLNLKHLLLKGTDAVNEVLFFGSYGQYRSGIEISNPEDSGAGIMRGGLSSYGNFNYTDDKMRVQSYGVKTRFFDRISLSGDWYKNDNYIYTYFQIFPSGSYRLLFPTEYIGWRVWSSAEIFRASKFKWNAGLNVFKNKMKIGTLPDNQIVSGIKLESTSATQAGMQQGFLYANFSLNMNVAAYFNNPVFKVDYMAGRPTVNIENTTFINLNYLSLGYNFKDQLKGAALKNLNVSFVARNLLQKKKNSENNVFSKTVGIALNASF